MKTLETKSTKEKQTESPKNPQEEMLQKLLAKLEKKNMETARLKEEILEYKKNGVSGLRRREVFYKAVESDLKDLAPEMLENIEFDDDEKLKEKVAKWNLEKLKNVKFSVLMSDMAFLSLLNDKGGHSAGDSLIKNIGRVATEEMGSPEIKKGEKESRFVAFRHGGDEFTAIIRDQFKNANALAKEFSLKIEKTKVESLEEYGLKPHLDVGVAHLSEGLEAFKELILAGVKIPGGDRVRKLQDLLVDIADQRSMLNKMSTRIKLLLDLFQKPVIYNNVIDNLRKGAKGTTDEEIKFLLQHDGVKEFVAKKLAEMSKTKEENTKIEKNIVEEIAGRETET